MALVSLCRLPPPVAYLGSLIIMHKKSKYLHWFENKQKIILQPSDVQVAFWRA
jgi:hypothetical protein